VPVPVTVKRLALRQLYAATVTAANSQLGAALLAAAGPSYNAAMAGKQVVEAQAEGVVTKYQLPPGLGVQSDQVASMWSELLDLYDLAQQPTTSIPPGAGLPAETANLPDAKGLAIYNWMLGRLAVIRSFSTDHGNPALRQ
jgi:hypothetical protein